LTAPAVASILAFDLDAVAPLAQRCGICQLLDELFAARLIGRDELKELRARFTVLHAAPAASRSPLTPSV
jgi:hypothetical protein